MSRYYDKQGNPIELMDWCEKYTDENKRIELTELANGYRVSTVWLGLDHGPSATGEPLIFETMVFGPDSWMDLDCNRYSTLDQAVEGHKSMVDAWTTREAPIAEDQVTP